MHFNFCLISIVYLIARGDVDLLGTSDVKDQDFLLRRGVDLELCEGALFVVESSADLHALDLAAATVLEDEKSTGFYSFTVSKKTDISFKLSFNTFKWQGSEVKKKVANLRLSLYRTPCDQ